jgi:hypothetical protein
VDPTSPPERCWGLFLAWAMVAVVPYPMFLMYGSHWAARALVSTFLTLMVGFGLRR